VFVPSEFERCLLKMVNRQVKLREGEIVALDGKTPRGLHNKVKEQDAVEIVSPWAVSERLILGQVKAPDGSNEITYDSVILSILDLPSSVLKLSQALRTALGTCAAAWRWPRRPWRSALSRRRMVNGCSGNGESRAR